jgi:acyl-CoA reductase-like NAD-dependent aldehyde dehydrogenase
MATKFILGGSEQASLIAPLEVLYPWDQSTEVGSCYRFTEADFPNLFEKAAQGFNVFRKSKVMERMTILSMLANRLQKERESLSRLITLETGKPIKLSRLEVDRAIGVCRGYADLLNRYDEEWLYVQDRKAQIKRFPYGPMLAITPFNFPLNLIMHKLAPAIAAGTSFTVKPASKTPMTALFLGALAIESGYHFISVIPSDGATAEKLVQSGFFPKISFTGSSEVGWRLRLLASRSSVSLELGSNSACIIDDFSYGLPAIAKRCAESAFQFAGQSCIALQRIYIRQALYEEWMQVLFDAATKMRVGDPMKPTTDLGPLISLEDVQRVRILLRDAIQQNANIAFGGSTYNALTYNPTILNRIDHAMRVVQEEVFAPLLVVHPYESFEEALSLVNQSQYGLHAGLYTEDPQKVTHAFETLEVGGLLHNDTPTTRLDYLPYGGVKDSGFGREGVISGIEEITYPKTLILRQ